jgi:hypothetical protein
MILPCTSHKVKRFFTVKISLIFGIVRGGDAILTNNCSQAYTHFLMFLLLNKKDISGEIIPFQKRPLEPYTKKLVQLGVSKPIVS